MVSSFITPGGNLLILTVHVKMAERACYPNALYPLMTLLTFHIFLLIFLSLLALAVIYLMVLTIAAWQAGRHTEPARGDAALPRFAFLIPAHNEEQLLPECLGSLAQLDYPRQQYTVLVIADNCQDQTARVAKAWEAEVTERINPNLRGKGYALEWGFEHLQASQRPYDAIIILDADTSLSANFLRVMAARVARGERAIQPYYSVRNAERSWSENLRYVALTVLHYLRPQGRMVLGGSAGLKGNGMLFATDILSGHHWTSSITEDIEFHMDLLLDGERVTFAPDAVVWGEMPNSLAGARSQVDRWEQGRLEMARRYVPRLLQSALNALRQGQPRRAYRLLDAVMEHLIPPFSVLAGSSALGLLAALFLFALPGRFGLPAPEIPAVAQLAALNLSLALFIIAGQLYYLFSGLKLAKAPASAYRALIYAPLFTIWKIGQYLRLFLRRGQQEWVRTARNGG